MGMCVAGIAMALMATKILTWLTVARFHATTSGNVIYVFSTIMMVWTYALSMTVDAGPPLTAVDNKIRNAEDGDADKEDECDSFGGYCERCDVPKPAHVHHCSACRRCVYRMDHHCPWTNNCVGNSNKKFFLLFLVYTSLSCLTFNGIISPLVFSDDPVPAAVRHLHKSLVQFGWMMSLAIGGILAGYFTFHMWLLRRGKTTLEFISGKPGELEKYPFWFNVCVYFGRNPLSWWLPFAPQRDSRVRGRREAQQLI